MERTLILFKPDCVQRRLVGRILARLEDKGLNLIGLKMLQFTPELAATHYAEHVEKPFYPSLEEFITSGPVVAAVVEGNCAIQVVRQLMGPTSGIDAPAGTIRGDFSLSRQMNLMHGSDSAESAAREIPIFFADGELCPYRADLAPWISVEGE
jgi:nucleoside-diphosphate kinase